MPTTPPMHTVCVFSAMRGVGWQGQVSEADCTDLDSIFRYFNRVDKQDGPRLEAIGYRLPSLSASDLVGLVRNRGGIDWYVCASAGWESITDAQAFAYMVLAYEAAHSDDAYPPSHTSVEGGTLTTILSVERIAIDHMGAVKEAVTPA